MDLELLCSKTMFCNSIFKLVLYPLLYNLHSLSDKANDFS